MLLKRILSVLVFFNLSISVLYSQITNYPTIKSSNNKCFIEKIQLTEKETIVTIKVPRTKKVKFSSSTVIVPSEIFNDISNLKLEYPERLIPTSLELIGLYQKALENIEQKRTFFSKAGLLIRSLGRDKLDAWYKCNEKGRDYYYFELHFDRLPYGVENICIKELIEDGWEWVGIKINNPYPNVQNIGLNEFEIKQKIDEQNNGIVGIYEGFSNSKYKLACIMDGNEYKLIYLDASNPETDLTHWKKGDVKAVLRPSATPGFFKANYYMANKAINTEVYVMFESGSMKIVFNEEEDGYLKMYPIDNYNETSSIVEEWSGTGFALNDGYIATNYHVVENAKSINIYGINGDFTTQYNATVVATDKYNDIALLQITDEKFDGFGVIPYNVKTAVSDVGENIFVLGYPLTSTMGDEIKLTTGVVSSKTGFQGDVSIYQISAPIQPGNSGGPLFDNNGNLIGIVNAKHNEAENVGYAIKTSYLQNLIESSISSPILPYNKQLANLALTEKVKRLKNFVFMIKCSNLNNNNKVHKSTSYTNNIIEHPLVGVTTAKREKIKSVTLSQDYTAIEITSNNLSETDNSYYTWVMIDKDTYILANGKRYTMTRADGIKIAPEKTYYSYAGQDITFTLYFPPIPETTSIDLIEPGDSDWKFYNISLK